jgi:hypothetical protein
MMYTPNHYRVASHYGAERLQSIGIKPEHLRMECFEALEQHYPWILRDAYLFNVVKYWWRMGLKGDAADDKGKAYVYARRGLRYHSKWYRRMANPKLYRALKVAKAWGLD